MKQMLKRIIRDFHTSTLPPFKHRHLKVPFDLNKIITIVGPRRAGKTWYLFQLISQLEARGIKRHQILYINFEDERLDFRETGNDILLDAYLELYSNLDLSQAYFFFDEIQELPNWEKFIRRLYDSVTQNIFLTGSNSKMLSQEIASALRGRSLSFELFPLSFKEFLEFRGLDYEDRFSTKKRAILQNQLEEYLIWGGYPELVNIDPRFRLEILQEYMDVMIYRDLIERYGIRDAVVLKFLIRHLISSVTKEFSINKLYHIQKSSGFNIGKDTIYQMIDQIFSIYFLTFLEKYDPSVIRRQMTNKKLYLYDNGFASATNYLFSEDKGKLLENAVFSHLRRKSKDIYFLKNRWECDFASFPKGNDKVALLQVTAALTKENIKRELKGLLKAKNLFNNANTLLIAHEINLSDRELPRDIETIQALDWFLKE